jgi:tRNA (guanine-N7-)-methyltransferase
MERNIRTYVKRSSRVPSLAQKDLLNEHLQNYEITFENLSAKLSKLSAKKINFEIGFGSGEHILMQALARPDEVFIGCEPFLPGVIKLLRNIVNQKIDNILIFNDDALDLLEKFPDDFLSELFVLFPDPWPKTKHHKRRIISIENLELFKQKLKTKGKILVATDHEDYASVIIARLMKISDLHWDIKSVRDWYKAPKLWTETKYFSKAAREGRRHYFFHFVNAK